MSNSYRRLSCAVARGLYEDLVAVHEAIEHLNNRAMYKHWMLLRTAAIDNDKVEQVSGDKTTFLVRLLMMHDLPEDLYYHELDKMYKALCKELPPAPYRSAQIYDHLNWQISVLRAILYENAARSLSKARLFGLIKTHYKESLIYRHAKERAMNLSYGMYDIADYEGEDNEEAA